MRRNILQEIAENAPPPGATEDVPDGFFLTVVLYLHCQGKFSTYKKYKQLLNERIYPFLKSRKTTIHRQ